MSVLVEKVLTKFIFIRRECFFCVCLHSVTFMYFSNFDVSTRTFDVLQLSFSLFINFDASLISFSIQIYVHSRRSYTFRFIFFCNLTNASLFKKISFFLLYPLSMSLLIHILYLIFCLFIQFYSTYHFDHKSRQEKRVKVSIFFVCSYSWYHIAIFRFVIQDRAVKIECVVRMENGMLCSRALKNQLLADIVILILLNTLSAVYWLNEFFWRCVCV